MKLYKHHTKKGLRVNVGCLGIVGDTGTPEEVYEFSKDEKTFSGMNKKGSVSEVDMTLITPFYGYPMAEQISALRNRGAHHAGWASRKDAEILAALKASDVLVIGCDLADDHCIRDARNFIDAIQKASDLSHKPDILLVGVRPPRAEYDNSVVLGRRITALEELAGRKHASCIASSVKEVRDVTREKIVAMNVFRYQLKSVNKFIVDKEDKDNARNQAINLLEAYIHEIGSHRDKKGDINFKHGFHLFKGHQAHNRKANYKLAEALLEELKNTDNPLGNVFDKSRLAQIRKDKRDLFHLSKPSANSRLHHIIKKFSAAYAPEPTGGRHERISAV